MKTPLVALIVTTFLISSVIGPMPQAGADEFRLPVPGVMVHLSPPLDPPILKGIKVYPDNPFRFEFILDKGDDSGVIASEAKQSQQEQLRKEAAKLIKYFLASLTIPDKDLWVNLSPYEKDRIIPSSFGLTEMGRDLLAEDYMLKQITASLIYPEDKIGKKFWKRIYEEAAKRYGTTNIPVNTFNKVWIVPEKAVVFENAKEGTAYVVESKLKVMLEQDYLSLEKHSVILSPSLRSRAGSAKDLKAPLDSSATPQNDVNKLGSQIVREIVIPELTTEINENKNFTKLRQVYNSLILAAWYKKKIKDGILAQVYADKNKTAGIQYTSTVIPARAGIKFKNDVEGLYQEYLKAFKKGVYNYIKEDIDPLTQETIPRKYFSGGVSFAMTAETGGGETALKAKVDILNQETAPRSVIRSIMKTVATGLFVVLAAINVGNFKASAGTVNMEKTSLSLGQNMNTAAGKTSSSIDPILAARQSGLKALEVLGIKVHNDASLEEISTNAFHPFLSFLHEFPNELILIPGSNTNTVTASFLETVLSNMNQLPDYTPDTTEHMFNAILKLSKLNDQRVSWLMQSLQKASTNPSFFKIFEEKIKAKKLLLPFYSDPKGMLEFLKAHLTTDFTFIDEPNNNLKISITNEPANQTAVSLDQLTPPTPAESADWMRTVNLVLVGFTSGAYLALLKRENNQTKELLRKTMSLTKGLREDVRKVREIFNRSKRSTNKILLKYDPVFFRKAVDGLSEEIQRQNYFLQTRLTRLKDEELRPWDGVDGYRDDFNKHFSDYQELLGPTDQLAQRAPDDASKKYIEDELKNRLTYGFTLLARQRRELDKTLVNFNLAVRSAKFVYRTFAGTFSGQLFKEVYALVRNPNTSLSNNQTNLQPKTLVIETQPAGESAVIKIRPLEYYIDHAPVFKNLNEALNWYENYRIYLITSSDKLSKSRYMDASTAMNELLNAGKLPNSKAKNFNVSALRRALDDRHIIESEIRRILAERDGTRYPNSLARLRARFSPRSPPNSNDKRKNIGDLSEGYRNLILGYAYQLYGEALIKELEAKSIKEAEDLFSFDVGEAVMNPVEDHVSPFVHEMAMANPAMMNNAKKVKFAPVPYRQADENKLLKALSGGILFTIVMGFLFHFIELDSPTPSLLPIGQDQLHAQGIVSGSNNAKPVFVNRTAHLNKPHNFLQPETLTPQQLEEYKKHFRSDFYKQIIYHAALGDLRKESTMNVIFDKLNEYYGPDFVNNMMTDPDVKSYINKFQTEFSDYPQEEAQKWGDVYNLFTQSGIIGDQEMNSRDLDSFFELASLDPDAQKFVYPQASRGYSPSALGSLANVYLGDPLYAYKDIGDDLEGSDSPNFVTTVNAFENIFGPSASGVLEYSEQFNALQTFYNTIGPDQFSSLVSAIQARYTDPSVSPADILYYYYQQSNPNGPVNPEDMWPVLDPKYLNPVETEETSTPESGNQAMMSGNIDVADYQPHIVSQTGEISIDAHGRLAGVDTPHQGKLFEVSYDKKNEPAKLTLFQDIKEYDDARHVLNINTDQEEIYITKGFDSPLTVVRFKHNSDVVVWRFDEEGNLIKEQKINLLVKEGGLQKMWSQEKLFDIHHLDSGTLPYLMWIYRRTDLRGDVRSAIQSYLRNYSSDFVGGNISTATHPGRLSDSHVPIDYLLSLSHQPGDKVKVLDTSASILTTSYELHEFLKSKGYDVQTTGSEYLTKMHLVYEGRYLGIFDSRGTMLQFIDGPTNYLGQFQEYFKKRQDDADMRNKLAAVRSLERKYKENQYKTFLRLDPQALEAGLDAKSGFHASEDDVFNLHRPREEFDIIRSFNFMLHLKTGDQIRQAMQNMGTLLKDGGYLLVGEGDKGNVQYGLWQRQGQELIRQSERRANEQIRQFFKQAAYGFSDTYLRFENAYGDRSVGDLHIPESPAMITANEHHVVKQQLAPGTNEKGGIDLTPANMNLMIRNAGVGIKFHLNPAMLAQLRNAPGFTPVIINIQPLDSLQKFLGLSASQDVAANS